MMVDTHTCVIARLPGVPKLNQLQRAEIAGRIFDGRFTVKTADGRPARLAIVDEQGNVVEVGEDVEKNAWAVALTTYCAMLLAESHVTVTTNEPEFQALLRGKELRE